MYAAELVAAGEPVRVETIATRGPAPRSGGAYAAEHATLLAVVHTAAVSGGASLPWIIVWSLAALPDGGVRWREWELAAAAAHDAAVERGDRLGQAHALTCLTIAQARLDRCTSAETAGHRAVELFDALGMRFESGIGLTSLAWLAMQQGRHRDALRHLDAAATSFSAEHPAVGESLLNSVGACHAGLGDREAALRSCEQALERATARDDTYALAVTWHSLADMQQRFGAHREAASCHRAALDCSRRAGHRLLEAVGCNDLADVYHATGQDGPARERWHRALTILDALRHPDAGKVRAKLRQPS